MFWTVDIVYYRIGILDCGFDFLKEIQRKKLKSSRMSRRKRDLVAAREQSKMQEQAEEVIRFCIGSFGKN